MMTNLSWRADSVPAAMLAVVLIGCAADQRRPPERDSAPAAAVTAAAPAAVPDAAPARPPAPLSHDSVVIAPGDTGVRVGPDGHVLFPIVFAATCEGEDCETRFTGLACAGVDLRSAPDTTSSVVARVAKGDSIHVMRTDLHVLRPGIVIVKRPFLLDAEGGDEGGRLIPRLDTLRFAAGDTVYLLRYEMLGTWAFRAKGKTTDGGEFWGGPLDDRAIGEAGADTSRAVARSQPVMEEYWLLEDGTRPIGWWRADTTASLRSEYNMEHWGDHCPGWQPSPAR